MAVQAQFFLGNGATVTDVSNRYPFEEGINLQYLIEQQRLQQIASNADFQESKKRFRCDDSTATSTSAQKTAQQLVYQQTLEIDAIVRLHTEKLRSALQESTKRNLRSLISAVDSQATRKLREKEAELIAISRRNADLEEKIRKVSGEREVWMSVARNNEAIVAGLRSAVEQLLMRSGGGVAGDGEGAPEDAESCCFEPAIAGEDDRRVCVACRVGDVSVLVLPCRHLCLCSACDSLVDTCPVCRSAKNASLRVFMA